MAIERRRAIGLRWTKIRIDVLLCRLIDAVLMRDGNDRGVAGLPVTARSAGPRAVPSTLSSVGGSHERIPPRRSGRDHPRCGRARPRCRDARVTGRGVSHRCGRAGVRADDHRHRPGLPRWGWFRRRVVRDRRAVPARDAAVVRLSHRVRDDEPGAHTGEDGAGSAGRHGGGCTDRRPARGHPRDGGAARTARHRRGDRDPDLLRLVAVAAAR